MALRTHWAAASANSGVTKIPYKYAKSLISNSLMESQQKQYLLTILSSRSPEDIYCRVNYRIDDYNVVMRLRAWGPKAEVF